MHIYASITAVGGFDTFLRVTPALVCGKQASTTCQNARKTTVRVGGAFFFACVRSQARSLRPHRWLTWGQGCLQGGMLDYYTRLL